MEIKGLEVMPDHVHLFVATRSNPRPAVPCQPVQGLHLPPCSGRSLRTWSRNCPPCGGAVLRRRRRSGHRCDDPSLHRTTKDAELGDASKPSATASIPPVSKRGRWLTMLDTHRQLYNRALAERKDAWEQRAAQRTVRRPVGTIEGRAHGKPVSCADQLFSLSGHLAPAEEDL